MKVKSLSHVQLLVTPWTAAFQAPPPMGFSRQEYWSGVSLQPGIEPRSPALQADSLPAEPQGKPNTGVGSLFPSPADLPNPGIKPGSPALQADSLSTEPSGKPHHVIHEASSNKLINT